MESNSHKKLYRIDKFARRFYCANARLRRLRNDKRMAKVAVRKANKKEISEHMMAIAGVIGENSAKGKLNELI